MGQNRLQRDTSFRFDKPQQPTPQEMLARILAARGLPTLPPAPLPNIGLPGNGVRPHLAEEAANGSVQYPPFQEAMDFHRGIPNSTAMIPGVGGLESDELLKVLMSRSGNGK